ncbi:TMEM175 family protein [Catellatospora sp. KI3]|uniref:TMEM175 family protein n=1 Tax=Catellatospora sp. KI3 TaxID=3041620 RepID=UPI0024827EBA|nr:TMEM175 family protein [Catellatospora sp. KI3]MDI1465489.1 TMEM175 family protein [Catellatospora sp. KI3]
MESNALSRTMAFTDGVVAIALTLLILPLADTAKEAAVLPVGELVGEHAGDFLAFVTSFLVVSLFWMVHRRIFENLARVGEGVLMLNILWLLGVVFLPVPTAVLTYEVGHESGAAVLYMVNLTFIALSGLLLSLRIRHRPVLQRADRHKAVERSVRRGYVSTGAMVVTLLVAVPLGNLALPLLALLPLMQVAAARRWARRHGDDTDQGDADLTAPGAAE